MKTIKSIAREALYIFRRYPVTAIPFLIMAVMDLAALYVLYLAPQHPVSVLLAPPVRAFWGEQFLHYPMNLFLLPKLYNYAHIVLLGIVGVFTTGWSITMIEQAYQEKSPVLMRSALSAVKRYVSLLIIGILIFLFSFFLGRLAANTSIIITYAIYFFNFLIQIIFLYAMAAVVIRKGNVIGATNSSFLMAKKYFVVTLLLSALTGVLYFPLMLLKENLSFFVNKFYPDSIMAVLALTILATALIDIIITFLVAVLFLKENINE